MNRRFPSGMWAILLLVSVLMNGVLLGALAAGAHLARSRPILLGPPPLYALTNSLDEELSEELVLLVRERAEATRPLFAEVRRTDRAVIEALAAEPFDAAVVRAAYEDAAAAQAALDNEARGLTITLFQNLPQEMRLRLLRSRELPLFTGPRGPGVGAGAPERRIIQSEG